MTALASKNIPDSSIQIHTLQQRGSRIYFIESRDGLILVDAGWPGCEKAIVNAMHKIGRLDLRLIFLTHSHIDHFGSAAAVQRLTRAPIAIHKADAAALSKGETPIPQVKSWGVLGKYLLPMVESAWRPEATQADILFENGYRLDAFGIDAFVMHTPGHTPGSSCLVLQNQIFFAGDVFGSLPWFGPQRYYADNWAQVSDSIAAVIEMDPLWVFAGHGKPASREKIKKIFKQKR